MIYVHKNMYTLTLDLLCYLYIRLHHQLREKLLFLASEKRIFNLMFLVLKIHVLKKLAW